MSSERPTPPAASPPGAARPDAPERRDALRAIAGLGLAVAGCGGGGEIAGVGTGGTGQIAYASGTVSGFGSVIVNGVKFEDRDAQVSDDAGSPRALAALAIGMLVEIEGRIADDGATGTADRIRIASELCGGIDSIDAAAGRFTVMGTTVQTGAATVFPDVRGLAGLALGTTVEVHGFVDVGASLLRATRIDVPPASAAPSPCKLRGTIIARDGDGDGSIRIGGLQIDPRSAKVSNGTVGGLQVGQTVRLEGTTPPRSGTWRPDELAVLAGPGAAVGIHTRLEGTITSFRSLADLQVAGVPVDASGATLTDGLRASALRDGRRVRVIGVTAAGGRVIASSLQPRDDDAVDGSGDDLARFEGTILRFGSLADFEVRDRVGRRFTVDGSRATLRAGTTVADLRQGAALTVEGRRGTPFAATSLRIGRHAED
jgi:hypothetical protein